MSTSDLDHSFDPQRRHLLAGGALAAGAAALGATGAAAQTTSMPGAQPGILTGQVALVTGAGRGIGRAIAVALAASGAHVAALDIAHDIEGHAVPMARPEDLAETIRLIRAEGRRAVSLQADTRDLDAMSAAVARAERELGPIAVLVANAGVNSNVKFAGTEEAAYRRHWEIVTDVNVKGTANTLRAAMPGMMGRKAGRVVITSSTFGRQGNDMNPAYVASKWALVGLTKAAAIEAGAAGVTVNAIAPTAVRTGLGGPQTAEARASSDEWLKANYHKLPVGLLEPEDMAGTVVYLASPAARYVTGQVVDVAAGANTRYTA